MKHSIFTNSRKPICLTCDAVDYTEQQRALEADGAQRRL